MGIKPHCFFVEAIALVTIQLSVFQSAAKNLARDFSQNINKKRNKACLWRISIYQAHNRLHGGRSNVKA